MNLIGFDRHFDYPNINIDTFLPRKPRVDRLGNIDRDDVYIDLQFAELELFYQIVKIHKFLNMQEGQGR